MDFREELNNIRKDLTAEEILSATILNIKIKEMSLSSDKRISRIIFEKDDKFTLTSSVEIDCGEPVILFKKFIPIVSDLSLKKIKELLDKNDFYSVYDNKKGILYWLPNRW